MAEETTTQGAGEVDGGAMAGIRPSTVVGVTPPLVLDTGLFESERDEQGAGGWIRENYGQEMQQAAVDAIEKLALWAWAHDDHAEAVDVAFRVHVDSNGTTKTEIRCVLFRGFEAASAIGGNNFERVRQLASAHLARLVARGRDAGLQPAVEK
jgi:hypothetical protein